MSAQSCSHGKQQICNSVGKEGEHAVAMKKQTWPRRAGSKLAGGPGLRPPILPEEKALLYTNLQVPLS